MSIIAHFHDVAHAAKTMAAPPECVYTSKDVTTCDRNVENPSILCYKKSTLSLCFCLITCGDLPVCVEGNPMSRLLSRYLYSCSRRDSIIKGASLQQRQDRHPEDELSTHTGRSLFYTHGKVTTGQVRAAAMAGRIDLDKPRWDQSTFIGRFKHFWAITNWTKSFKSNKELDEAKDLVDNYKRRQEPSGVTTEELWNAKHLVDSAFHPDTGERMNIIGRMTFQVPGGLTLTGAMLQWYRTVPAVVFWQWMNQSFNALANYTNRNAKSEITNKQIGIAYLSATTSAVAVSVGLNQLVKTAPPLLARYVPFVAVAAANCVNIPLMRQREVANGVVVYDNNGNPVGLSKKAAIKGITQVIISRIAMMSPGMLVIPIIMERIEKYPFMQRVRFLHGPLQMLLCGVSLTFMVPAACSIFPQGCSLRVDQLEPELQEKIRKQGGQPIDKVYFNKGL